MGGTNNKPVNGEGKHHPYSEEADAERRNNEDPQRGPGGFCLAGLISLLIIVLGVSFCTARAEAQFAFHWQGERTADQMIITYSDGGHPIITEATFRDEIRAGRTIHIAGECYSSCTLALIFPGTTWSERTWRIEGAVFFFHRTASNGQANNLSRNFFERLPEQLQACLPPPETWTLEFTPDRTFTGRQMTQIMAGQGCP